MSGCVTHCAEVREEAEGGRSIEPERQEVLEVEVRLQGPSRDRQGGQEGVALGRGAWMEHNNTTGLDKHSEQS